MILSIITAEAVCIFVYLAILGANFESWKRKDKLTFYYFGMVQALLIGTICDSLSYIFLDTPITNLISYFIELLSNSITYSVEFFSLPFFIGYIIQLSKQNSKQLKFKKFCFPLLHAFGLITFFSILISMLPLNTISTIAEILCPIIYVAMEFILLIMTAIALCLVRKDISLQYSAVGWSIIVGILLSRGLTLIIEWADFSYVAATCSVLLMHLFIQTEEVHKSQERERYLLYMSLNDKLSGLYNRTAYEDHMASLKVENLSDDFRHIMIDLNNLKYTNDTIGHEAGDELIKAMGNILQDVISTYGNAYRIGGDEFSCIIHANQVDFENMLELLKDKAASFVGTYITGFSFAIGYAGIYDFSNKSFTMEEIKKLSDQRMYEDKQRFYKENKQLERRSAR